MHPIKCEHPVLLFNRAVISTMVNNGNYVVDGVEYDVPRRWLYDFPYHRFMPYKLGLYRNPTHPAGYYLDTHHEERFYTYSPATGECTPLFIATHCGKCVCCQARKVREFSYRVVCEASCYDVPPIFITLTYRDKYLPSDGVCVRDVQLFFKSLRHLVDQSFRYALVSEYGKTKVYTSATGYKRVGTGRPHYHLVLFGLRVNKNEVSDFVDKVQRAWSVDLRRDTSKDMSIKTNKGVSQMLYRQQRGCVDVEFIRFSRACGLYVSKYLMKPKNVPDGMNKNFCCTSRRHGGIGAPFLAKHNVIDYLRNNPRCRAFQYKTYDGELCQLVMTKYYFGKIFPTRSRLVPVEYRRAIDGVQCLCNQLFAAREEFKQPLLAVGIEDLDYPNTYTHNKMAFEQSDVLIADIYSLCDIIDSYPPPNEALIKKIDDARSIYCAVPPVDVDMMSQVLKDVNLLSDCYEVDSY